MAKVNLEVLARQIERLITDPATLKDDAIPSWRASLTL